MHEKPTPPPHTGALHARIDSNHLGVYRRAGGYVAGAATAAGNWATLPLVFGIMAFVYSGHGVFPSVRASMRHPEQFPKARHQTLNPRP